MNLRHIVEKASAIRLRQRLLPEGGQIDKVFPPSFAGGVYCWEQRRVEGKSVHCVLLDSVASQANRMEERLAELASAKAIDLPRLIVKFKDELAQIGDISTLTAPHRVFDAILRDSSTKDGKPFFKSELYQQLTACNVRNATALFASAPTALLFGCWDSTGAAGGLGNKFARAITAEIVGINAAWGATQGGVRQDPLGIRAEVEIAIDDSGDWKMVGRSATGKKDRAKGTRPAEINHGSILVKVDSGMHEYVSEDGEIISRKLPLKGGVTIDYALQTVVISLAALRRLKFPVNNAFSADQDNAARTVLATLGLVAITAVREWGYWLRSRCGLVVESAQDIEVVQPDGSVSTLKMDGALAIEAYKEAVDAAQKAGLPWHDQPVELVPQNKLVDLITQSRQIQSLAK